MIQMYFSWDSQAGEAIHGLSLWGGLAGVEISSLPAHPEEGGQITSWPSPPRKAQGGAPWA